MVVIVVAIVLVLVLVLRVAVRRAALFIWAMTSKVPLKVAGSSAWARLRTFWQRLEARYPIPFGFVACRFDPQRPTGLPMTLVMVAALYLLALFSGLTEDILEAKGTIASDNLINAAFGPLRTEPFISAFLWVTSLGNTPSVVAAVIIATGFLWSQQGIRVVIPLWITCLGALATTGIGKLLITRHRPETMLDANAMGWSFPSGHATAAMAVYGFIAYAIARMRPDFRERFEVAYWAGVMIFLIGFSRIFLGVHYVTDIMGGFLVGGFWLLMGFTMAEWRGWHPSLHSGMQGQRAPQDDGQSH